MNDTLTVREDWLNAAIDALRPAFAEIKHELPETIHVSTGFPLARTMGENKNIRAMTFARKASNDGQPSVYVSPFEKDTPAVILVLIHELIHVVLDCEDGHKGRFAEIAKLLGLESPLTELHAGPALAAMALTLAEVLGDYPHKGMDTLADIIDGKAPKSDSPITPDGSPRFHSAPKRQTNRTIACHCTECGYRVRTTAHWLAVAVPKCPVHDSDMEVA